ncbi:hypothetical protein Tco_0549278 [Tanacetum coccineum]
MGEMENGGCETPCGDVVVFLIICVSWVKSIKQLFWWNDVDFWSLGGFEMEALVDAMDIDSGGLSFKESFIGLFESGRHLVVLVVERTKRVKVGGRRWSTCTRSFDIIGNGYPEKDKNKAKNDKTGHGMEKCEKTKLNQSQKVNQDKKSNSQSQSQPRQSQSQEEVKIRRNIT